MKWLPKPMKTGDYIDTISRAYKERAVFADPDRFEFAEDYNWSFPPPPKRATDVDSQTDAIVLLKSLLEHYCVDFRKFNDWQSLGSMGDLINEAWKNPDHQFWKDFSLDHALLTRAKPYNAAHRPDFWYEAAKFLNSFPFYRKPYGFFHSADFYQRKLDGADFAEGSEPQEGNIFDQSAYPFKTDPAYLVYWDKGEWAFKTTNHRLIHYSHHPKYPGYDNLQGTVKIKEQRCYQKVISYISGSGIPSVNEKLYPFEVETSVPVENSNGGEYDIVKIQDEIDTIFNNHNEQVDYAWIRLWRPDSWEPDQYFFTKENYPDPEYRYLDENAIPIKW